MVKKIFFLIIFFQLFLLHSENLEKFWKSLLVIRPGILDFGNSTVEELFKDKRFKKNKDLDGTETIIEYGEITLNGNKVDIPIISKNNFKEIGEMEFRFLYTNEYVVLYEVYLANYDKFQFNTYKDFGEIVYILQLYNELIFDVVYKITNERVWINDNGKYYIIDKDNNINSDFVLDMKPEFNKDNMALVEFNDKWSIITLEGKYVIEPLSDSIPIYFNYKNTDELNKYDLKECKIFIQEIDSYLRFFNINQEYYRKLIEAKEVLNLRIDYLNKRAQLYENNKESIDKIELEILKLTKQNSSLSNKNIQTKAIIGFVIPTIVFGVTGLAGLGVIYYSSPAGASINGINTPLNSYYDIGTPGFTLLMSGIGLLSGGFTLCLTFGICAGSIKKIFKNKIENNNNKIKKFESEKENLLSESKINLRFYDNTFELSWAYNF